MLTMESRSWYMARFSDSAMSPRDEVQAVCCPEPSVTGTSCQPKGTAISHWFRAPKRCS